MRCLVKPLLEKKVGGGGTREHGIQKGLRQIQHSKNNDGTGSFFFLGRYCHHPTYKQEHSQLPTCTDVALSMSRRPLPLTSAVNLFSDHRAARAQNRDPMQSRRLPRASRSENLQGNRCEGDHLPESCTSTLIMSAPKIK